MPGPGHLKLPSQNLTNQFIHLLLAKKYYEEGYPEAKEGGFEEGSWITRTYHRCVRHYCETPEYREAKINAIIHRILDNYLTAVANGEPEGYWKKLNIDEGALVALQELGVTGTDELKPTVDIKKEITQIFTTALKWLRAKNPPYEMTEVMTRTFAVWKANLLIRSQCASDEFPPTKAQLAHTVTLALGEGIDCAITPPKWLVAHFGTLKFKFNGVQILNQKRPLPDSSATLSPVKKSSPPRTPAPSVPNSPASIPRQALPMSLPSPLGTNSATNAMVTVSQSSVGFSGTSSEYKDPLHEGCDLRDVLQKIYLQTRNNNLDINSTEETTTFDLLALTNHLKHISEARIIEIFAKAWRYDTSLHGLYYFPDQNDGSDTRQPTIQFRTISYTVNVPNPKTNYDDEQNGRVQVEATVIFKSSQTSGVSLPNLEVPILISCKRDGTFYTMKLL